MKAFDTLNHNVLPFFNKYKNRLSIIWFDSYNESEGENSQNVIAYSGEYEAESEFNDEDMTNEELTANYRFFLTKWEEACMEVKKA